MRQQTFLVATFEGIEEQEQIVEGSLPYEEALKLATRLWESQKHFGVEIIDDDSNNIESIVWIKSKNC